MAKSQETMMVYKKYKVNPMIGCLMAFIQLPLFFAFYKQFIEHQQYMKKHY